MQGSTGHAGVGWRVRRMAAASAVVIAGVVLAAGAACDEPPATKRSMQRMLASLRILLPLAVDPDGFADPARAAQIREHLANVATAGGEVARHAKTEDQGARYLARRLGIEADRARELFEQGAVVPARLGVLRVTEYCVSCHVRLPETEPASFPSPLVAEDELERLEPAHRAHVQVAIRAFDPALRTLEALVREPGGSSIELLEQITSYLLVSMHAKRDFQRPVALLEHVAQRPDVWTHIKVDVDRWVSALDELAEIGTTSDRLEDAVAILAAARQEIRFPSDRAALVHYIAATGILERYLESEPTSTRERARAYYLLGVTESRIGASYWTSLPTFYLDTSIRLDPRGEWALSAYAVLEELVLCEQSIDCGAEVGQLPPSVEQYLEELRGLVSKDGAPWPNARTAAPMVPPSRARRAVSNDAPRVSNSPVQAAAGSPSGFGPSASSRRAPLGRRPCRVRHAGCMARACLTLALRGGSRDDPFPPIVPSDRVHDSVCLTFARIPSGHVVLRFRDRVRLRRLSRGPAGRHRDRGRGQHDDLRMSRQGVLHRQGHRGCTGKRDLVDLDDA